ncbi:MAG: septum formation protein Maf [Planctomycetaceae bacterium]|nr:septum formation protein Maf [Planctomycetaceae bacterium]
MELILASTSPWRREQLARLGLPFQCVDPAVDEDVWKARLTDPRELAGTLAREKARAVAAQHPEAVVIGGDQLVSFGSTILGKPGTAEGAVEQLLQLAGQTHELLTAVCLCHHGRELNHLDVTRLTMRSLDRGALTRYVAADDPVGCAGSYMLEQRGITLFERIESADHTAIIGLPLIALTGLLRQLGFEVP